VVIADGAMGTMLQGYDLALDDFDQLEGCNEILNLTRPDVVRAIHDAYFEVGVDAVETNTFGANLSALGEYGISDRIYELAKAAATIARASADAYSTPDRPRWVLGSVGPGTKLPTLGHVAFGPLRDAYQAQVEGMLTGGIDAVLIETSQDLLQTKAATLGAKRAIASADRDLPLIVHVTVETTGTMLLGSEIGAALTALEPLGIDVIGLNCATGPSEMSEHLRHLSRYASIGISCMPNAGLPQLTADETRRTGRRPRAVHRRVRPRAGRRLLRHDARAPASCRGASARPASGSPPADSRCRSGVVVRRRAVPAGH
jgi:5-methyltetrahydrofolate--homocysteine methyltransferase